MNIVETWQDNIDCNRALRAGLRDHDPVNVETAMTRIRNMYKKYGATTAEAIATRILYTTMHKMMDEEDWSFGLENEEPSPLV